MAEGPYTGRLAFNPDTGYHIDPDGEHVLTEDEGKTWRYAVEGDTSHIERYHKQPLVIAGTSQWDAHHLGPTADDAHFSPGATNDSGQVTNTRIGFHPDEAAHQVTSHTDAWKEAA